MKNKCEKRKEFWNVKDAYVWYIATEKWRDVCKKSGALNQSNRKSSKIVSTLPKKKIINKARKNRIIFYVFLCAWDWDCDCVCLCMYKCLWIYINVCLLCKLYIYFWVFFFPYYFHLLLLLFISATFLCFLIKGNFVSLLLYYCYIVLFGLYFFIICLFVRFYLAFVRNKDTDSTHHILFPRILFLFCFFFLYI